MDHTEKVLEEMLENLFAAGRAVDSDDESYAKNEESESPTNSFEDDVTEFFTNFNESHGDSNNEDKKVETKEFVQNTEDHQVDEPTSALKNIQNLSIGEELKRMHLKFPIDDGDYGNVTVSEVPKNVDLSTRDSCQNAAEQNDCEEFSSTDFTQKDDNNAFLEEVKRVLYSEKTENCPENNTPEYFDVAQEYAVYGNDFLDFPQDLEAIFKQSKLNKKMVVRRDVTPSSSEEIIIHPRNRPSLLSIGSASKVSETEILHPEVSKNIGGNSNCNILYRSESVEKANFDPTNYNGNSTTTLRPTVSDRPLSTNKQLSVAATAGAATAATYYQLCSNLQPALRPVTAVNAAGAAVNVSNPAYNMLLNNKVTYLANGTHNLPPQQVFYNQQQLSTTTNYFSNQAAIGTANNIRFPSPVVATTTTQQISNTVFKETQYLANVPVANAGGNVNVFERLVYAQMLQQKIYQTRQQQQQHQQQQHQQQQQQHQQQQQQAMVAAAIYQQQLQRQQQQMRIASNLQSAAMTIGGNVGNVGGYNNVIETSNTMAPSQSAEIPNGNSTISRDFPITTLNNCMETSGTFGCHIQSPTFDNTIDNNRNDNNAMN